MFIFNRQMNSFEGVESVVFLAVYNNPSFDANDAINFIYLQKEIQ